MWSEISSLRYDFAAAEERLAQLRAGSVTLAAIESMYRERVLGAGESGSPSDWPRRLSVQVFGENDKVESTESAWKQDEFHKGKAPLASVKAMKYVADTSTLGQLLV